MNLLTRDDILPNCFLYLKLCGVWPPTKCSPSFRIIYSIYTVIFLIGYTILVAAEITNVIMAKDNRFQIFQENMYLIFSHTNAYVKLINFIMRRKKVMLLIDTSLIKNWNPPRDEKELQILTIHNQIARYITLLYAIPGMICIWVYVLIPLVINVKILPFNGWYPCNLNSSFCYWLLYVHQSTCVIPAALIMVANDCIIAGFMLQISAQLKLLKHRLMNAPDKLKTVANGQTNKIEILELEGQIINECIECHNNILKYAHLLSETFIETVFFQFCVTLSVVCTTTYYIARISIYSLEFLAVFIYLSCMLMQAFYYCWFANEIILNSHNVFQSIFIMDWISLNKKSSKALLTMMTVASRPIELFKGIIVKVNLNTFVNIIKISYSLYNLLQSTF